MAFHTGYINEALCPLYAWLHGIRNGISGLNIEDYQKELISIAGNYI